MAADYHAACVEMGCKTHKTVDNRYFTTNYYVDGSKLGPVRDTVADAELAYCQWFDLILMAGALGAKHGLEEPVREQGQDVQRLGRQADARLQEG